MSIGVFTAAAVYVNDAKDKVEYTEEILNMITIFFGLHVIL